MRKTIQVLSGFDPVTNEPVYVTKEVIACEGFPDLKESHRGINPVHVRVHIDPNKPAKRRKKDDSKQVEMQLNDPAIPKPRRRK